MSKLDATQLGRPSRRLTRLMPASGEQHAGPLTVRALGRVLVLYALAIVAGTYPFVRSIFGALPTQPLDPLVHLWTMRWYQTCLATHRAPFHCPDLQYPVGAPLGFFPPMQLQTLLYLPLSWLTHNDILAYNGIWFFAFLFMGLGTFLLARSVVKDTLPAFVAGLLGMLSTPMIMHAYGHLELMHLGSIPLFLWGWLRFIDRPGKGTLAAAVALYWLVGMSAHYFVVLSVFPAALYVAWQAWHGGWGWLRARLAWLAAFSVLAVLGIALLYANQLWAMATGEPLTRPKSEFELYRAPLWGYFVPTMAHRLGRMLLTVDVYQAAGLGQSAGERASYLGIVTLALVYYAAVRKVRFERRGFWWLATAVLVVLSLGAYFQFGTRRIPMPAAGLWAVFPPFRLIRVVSRFNMLVAVCAPVVAAAGLKAWLERWPSLRARLIVVTVLSLVAFWDLSVPFRPQQVPSMPGCYEAILKQDPRATFLEIPQVGSAGCALNAACAYWQSLHHAPTSGGYGAHPNGRFDQQVTFTSPFCAWNLANPGYLADPKSLWLDLLRNVDFLDYTWLYLQQHGYRYIVLHQWPDASNVPPAQLERLKAWLAPAKVREDAATIVYDRAKLDPPSRAVVLCTEGWRQRRVWRGGIFCITSQTARLAVYQPEGGSHVVIGIEAQAFRRSRSVRLRDETGRELAVWQVDTSGFQVHESPRIALAPGLHAMTIESDGEDRPTHGHEAGAEGDMRPYSLRVARVVLSSQSGAQTP